MALIGSFDTGGASTTGKSNPYRDPFAAALPKAAPNVVSPIIGGVPKPAPTTVFPTYGTGSSAGSATTSVAKSGTDNSDTTAKPPAAPAAPGQSIYDLSTDPIVQKIQALNTANYGQAVAGAQANAKQDLIDSGFSLTDALAAHPDIAAAISGSPIGSVLTDTATNLAAAGNPFSTAAGLAKTHTQNNQGINQNENDNNLFYSSDRANQLGQESQNYLGSVSGAQGSLAAALSGLLGGLTTEQQTESQNLANTIETARENAIQNAISSGQVMLGYDANGNPIFGNAPGAGPSSTQATIPGGTDQAATGNTPLPAPYVPQSPVAGAVGGLAPPSGQTASQFVASILAGGAPGATPKKAAAPVSAYSQKSKASQIH